MSDLDVWYGRNEQSARAIAAMITARFEVRADAVSMGNGNWFVGLTTEPSPRLTHQIEEFIEKVGALLERPVRLPPAGGVEKVEKALYRR